MKILVTSIALLTVGSFHASAGYWDASDYLNNSNVGNPLNWMDDIAPLNDGTANLYFNSLGIGNSSTPNFGIPWSVNHIQVDSGYTFTGQGVTIGSGGLQLVGVGFGVGYFTFDNRIILTADQAFDLDDQNVFFNGGLDINATTLSLDSPGGDDFHTTGLYGTGTVNLSGFANWYHKAGGGIFHADVDISDYGNLEIEAGPGTQEFASGSAISITSSGGDLTINKNSLFDGGSVIAHSTSGIAFGSGISVTLQNGTQMTLGTVGVSGTTLDLNDVDMTVTGTGSALILRTDGIGIGNGSLSVLAGASTSSTDDNIGPSGVNVGGGGTLLVDGTGSTLTTSGGYTNAWGNSTGTATVTISNNAVASLTQVDVASGSALNAITNATVSSGADVTSSVLRIGTLGGTGSAGTVVVTGTGTTWTTTAGIYVGSAAGASGVLRVEDDATVSSGNDVSVFANGTIEIDGGIFNANDDVLVDGSGAVLSKTTGSAFNLAAGKTLTAQYGGYVVFDGAFHTGGGHLTMTASGELVMRTSSLFIESGSVVNVDGGALITSFGGSPTSVNGASSVLINSGNFLSYGDITFDGAGTTFTRSAAGVFTLFPGKTFNLTQGADAVFTGNYVLPDANINVTGAGSTWTQTDAETLNIGAAANGTATVTVGSGGTFTTSTGLTTVKATGLLNIQSGGTLTGASDFAGAGPVNIGGAYLPGTASGVDQTTSVSFAQDMTFFPTTSITMEIDETANDRLVFIGPGATHVTWNGTLNLALINGYVPQLGDSFDLFNFDPARDAGTFSTINLPALSPGLFWRTENLYVDGTVRVSLTANTYADWVADSGVTEGFNGDDDDDGIPNGIEFHLGSDPTVAGESPLRELTPVSTPIITTASVRFKIPVDPAIDTHYRLRASNNMGNWTTIASKDGTGAWSGSASVTVDPPVDGLTRITVAETLPLGAGRRFHRLEVNKP